MGYSFSPHIKKQSSKSGKGKSWPDLFSKFKFPSKVILKKLALAEFDLPKSKYLPDHIQLAIIRSQFRYLFRQAPIVFYRFLDRMVKVAKRKKRAAALSLLLFIFTISVGWGLSKQLEQQEKQKGIQELRSLESKIEEASSLLKLNPVKAKGLMPEIESGLASAQKKYTVGLNKEKVLSLKTKYEEFKSENFRVLPIEDFPLVYDFSFLGNNQVGSNLILLKDSVLVLDKFSGSIWELNNQNKKLVTFIENSNQLKDLIDATVYGQKLFLLTRSGVYAMEGNGKLELIISKDPEWGELTEVDVYQGNNLYLLDRGSGKIWKYSEGRVGGRSVWGSKKVYFVSNDNLDFKQARSVAVDGNVWVSFSDGGMIKLLRGKREDFSISGLDTPFGSDTSLVGDENSSGIYILDRKNNRLVVLNKLGNVANQYRSDVFSQVLSLSIDEKAKKVYLLVDKKVLSLSLK